MANQKQREELTVITKTYDLTLWSCNHTSKFPRNHRFGLGERIEGNLYDVLEKIFERSFITDSYACRKSKGTHAKQANTFRLHRRLFVTIRFQREVTQ